MDIKIIICDLDRTLLRSDKTISEYTLSVLEKCKQKGILIGFATARSQAAISQFKEIAKPDIVITNCGATAVFGDLEIYSALIPMDTANEIIKIKLSHKGVGIICANTLDGDLVSPVADTTHPDWKYWQVLNYDFSQGIDFGVCKFASQIFDTDVLDKISQIKDIRITHNHGEEWVMFTHKDAAKYNAIAAIARHLNIDTSDIAAFGDDFSDIEMLKNCGIGVAMLNAIDEAKAAADCICGSNDEDGVARWLKENLCQ